MSSRKLKCSACSETLAESHYGCEGCAANFCQGCGDRHLAEKTTGENDKILCRDCRDIPYCHHCNELKDRNELNEIESGDLLCAGCFDDYQCAAWEASEQKRFADYWEGAWFFSKDGEIER